MVYSTAHDGSEMDRWARDGGMSPSPKPAIPLLARRTELEVLVRGDGEDGVLGREIPDEDRALNDPVHILAHGKAEVVEKRRGDIHDPHPLDSVPLPDPVPVEEHGAVGPVLVVSGDLGVPEDPFDETLPKREGLDTEGRIDDEQVVVLQGGEVLSDDHIIIFIVSGDHRPITVDILRSDVPGGSTTFN